MIDSIRLVAFVIAAPFFGWVMAIFLGHMMRPNHESVMAQLQRLLYGLIFIAAGVLILVLADNFRPMYADTLLSVTWLYVVLFGGGFVARCAWECLVIWNEKQTRGLSPEQISSFSSQESDESGDFLDMKV
jgi:uncharacterized membrane protein YbjE (DUF340 family)